MIWMRRIPITDALVILVLACVAAGIAFWRASSLDPVIYVGKTETGYYPPDMWFGGDIPKNVTMLRDRHSEQHNITSEHPLISLVNYPPVFVLKDVVGLTLYEAVRIYWAALAGLWTVALFILMRLIGRRLLDSAIFALLGMTSAAAVFWFAVPEEFTVGSLTILVALCLVVAARRTKAPVLVYALANLVSMSVTLTNWMVGIFAAILNLPWRRALVAILGALLAASLLWGVEKAAFPEAAFFLTGSGRLRNDVYLPSPARIAAVSRVFFAHTMVMPQIGVKPEYQPDRPFMSVQESNLAYATPAGYAGVAIWLALLGIGIWGCASAWRQDRFVQLIGVTTLAQLALQVAFGGETYLYCMHFVPFLIVIASQATQTRLRSPSLVLAGGVAAAALINNQHQFLKALQFVNYIARIAAAHVR
jgi:hypothetical protein